MKIEVNIDSIKILKELTKSLGFIGIVKTEDGDMLMLCDGTFCTDEIDIKAYKCIQYLVDYIEEYE